MKLLSLSAFAAKTGSRACLKNHSRNLHAPLCGRFCPNSVAVARYGAFIRTKSPTNCDAHLAESLFQTRSNLISANCSAAKLLPQFLNIHFISFCSVATSSSMVSSLPSRISLATQVRIWLARSSLLKAFTAAFTAADWIRMSLQ